MKMNMKNKSTQKSKETQTQARSSEKKVTMHTFTFPEHGLSVQATDITHAKQLLQKRLKGE